MSEETIDRDRQEWVMRNFARELSKTDAETRDRDVNSLVQLHAEILNYEDLVSFARHCWDNGFFEREFLYDRLVRFDVAEKKKLTNELAALRTENEKLRKENELAILEAKIQLLRDIHADAVNEFGRQRGVKMSANDFVGNLVRLRETELTKEHFALAANGKEVEGKGK